MIFALVALSRIRRNGTNGKGLAIGALVVSGGWVLLFVAVLVFTSLTSAHRDPFGMVTSGGRQDVRSLKVGDCLESVGISSEVDSVPAVPCTQPHRAEVIGEFRLADGSYPGESEIEQQAQARCTPMIPSNLGALDPSTLDLYYLFPTQRTWAFRDRTVTCIVGSDTPLTAAIRPA